jgi:hypothetical protein
LIMLVGPREIRLGVAEGTFTREEVPQELTAVNEVLGISDLNEAVEPFVSAARAACPEANCCLNAIAVRSGMDIEEHVDGVDHTWTVPVDVISVTNGSRTEECRDRAYDLTDAITRAVAKCVAGQEEIVAAEKSVRQPFEDEMNGIRAEADGKIADLTNEAAKAAELEIARVTKNVRERVGRIRRDVAKPKDEAK